MAKLDRLIAKRQQWAEFYRSELASLDWLWIPAVLEYGNYAWQAFITYVTLQKRSCYSMT